MIIFGIKYLFVVKRVIGMVLVKNNETMSTFVKVMQRNCRRFFRDTVYRQCVKWILHVSRQYND